MDRDGLRPPEIMLAIALSEALQCWKNRKPVETIVDKPLPDVNDLNEAVPRSEWELDLDRKAEGTVVAPGYRLSDRSDLRRVLHLPEFNHRRPHRRRAVEGEGDHDACAARRPRRAGGEAQRIAR